MAIGSDVTVDRAAGAPDEPFWRGLEQGVVQIPACARCDAWIWPARPGCPGCGSDAVVWAEVDPVGRVYSWTRTWYPFVPERLESLPYVVLVVELGQAPEVRILGAYDHDDEIHIGAPVIGAIAPPTPETLGLPSLRWSIAD